MSLPSMKQALPLFVSLVPGRRAGDVGSCDVGLCLTFGSDLILTGSHYVILVDLELAV